MNRFAGALVTLGALAVLAASGPTSALAGAKDGPRRWTRTLKKNEEVTYKIFFVPGADNRTRGGEFAVIGDGSTDVDVHIYDQTGSQVGSDTLFTDVAVVRWPVNKAQTYTIKVKNLDAEDNTVMMAHN
jgi:hypothetical protein